MEEPIIELKEIHPYQGHEEWVLHYAEDRDGKRYFVKQVETGAEYAEAVDLYPCRYTYVATEKPVEQPEEQPEEEQA